MRRAERDGLITRRLDEDRIEIATLCDLTDLGRTLEMPLAAMAMWTEGKWQLVEAARRSDQLRATELKSQVVLRLLKKALTFGPVADEARRVVTSSDQPVLRGAPFRPYRGASW